MTIGGRKHWLWRAVDQDGYDLDEIVQSRHNTKAAKRLLVRLMKKQGCPPKRMVTDKLRSHGAARRQVMPTVEHRSHKGLNDRAENSHLPLRKRERSCRDFGRRASCKDSCPSFRRSEISSARLTRNTQPSPAICIASGLLHIGRPLPALQPDPGISQRDYLADLTWLTARWPRRAVRRLLCSTGCLPGYVGE